MSFDTSKFLPYVPEGATETFYDDVNAVVYTYFNGNHKPAAIAFTKRSLRKWKFRYQFKDSEQRETYIDKWLEGLRADKKAKEDRKTDSLKAMENIKIGSIFYCSWGYDQTNVDFFQVVELRGKKTVIVREIAQRKETQDHGDYGFCTPIEDHFIGENMKRRINERSSFSAYSFAEARLWDGSPKYWSTGH